MTHHCSEYELQLLCVSPGSLGDEEREALVRHVGECALCREQLSGLREFYQILETQLALPASERDAALARKLHSGHRLLLSERKARLAEKADSLAETIAQVIEPYRQSLPRRIAGYVRLYPVRSFVGVSFAALALLFAFTTLRPRFDRNPALVDGVDGFLVAKNGHGDELWRTYIGSNFNMANYIQGFQDHPERAMRVQDVDGDGRNEIFCIFGWTSSVYPTNNSVICYNSDGTERWRYDLHRSMTLGGVHYSDQYRFYHLELSVDKRTGNTELIAAARHDPWHPNVLVRLDGKTGKLLSEFWHPGQLREFDHRDIDHEGVDELFWGGQNNRLKHACVVVLDPTAVQGGAPAPEGYYPAGFPLGTEMFYILLPTSDLMKYSTDVTNEVQGLRMTADGMLEVVVSEPARPGGGSLYYYFDSTMACTYVRASDSYTAAHRLLEQDGKLASHLDDQFLEALRQQVEYWDGEKFVTTVSGNRFYREALASLQHP